MRFVVGEDTTCPEVSANTQHRVYCNGPLKPDTYYEVRMRAFTDMGYADSVPFKIKTSEIYEKLSLILIPDGCEKTRLKIKRFGVFSRLSRKIFIGMMQLISVDVVARRCQL